MKKRNYKYVSGSITIYMLLSLIIVLVLIFTVIESARVTATGAKLRGATYMAMDSVFSEYARPVFEDYGVMALWCKNGELAKRFEGYVTKNIEAQDYSIGIGTDLYGVGFSSASVSETFKVTDKNGEIFTEQVIDFMKNYIVEEAAEELLSKTKIFDQADKVNTLMEKINKYQDVFKKVEEAAGKVKESITSVKEKISEPITLINQMKTNLANFTGGDTSALNSYYSCLSQLKDSKATLLSLLGDVKDKTDAYYERVGEAGETIGSIEEELQINPDDFDEDVYAAVKEEIDDIKAKSGDTDIDYYNVGEAGKTAESLKTNLESLDNLFERIDTEIKPENATEVKSILEQYEQNYKAIDFSKLQINYDDSTTEKESSGFIDEISAIVSGGILEYVAPEASEKNIDTAELPSQTIKYSKSSPDESLLDVATEKVLMSEYVRKFFGNYTNPLEDTPLTYETEYILSGKKADKSCLRDTVNKIIAIRTGCNLISILKDSQKKLECYGLATALVGFTGMPVLIKIMQVVLMGTWSLAEAIVDVKLLLKGDKVPVIKASNEWNLSLTNVQNFTGDSLDGDGFEKGIEYEDYLRLLLFAQNKTEQAFRIMDMIQVNMTEKENKDFRMKDCISRAEIIAEYSVPKVFINFGIVKEYMQSDGDRYTFTISQDYAY